MLIPCFLVLVFVISTQSSAQINFLDNFWYLNRARLIWQGTLPDLFVYALSYPVVVGALDLVVKDVILSAMITNTVLLWCALVGVYILGEWLFGRRRISWLAVVLMLSNAYLFDVLRLFWATLPFMTAVVWSVIACIYVIRRPTIGKALLLGAILALATYTRVEGTMYAIFIPIASAIVYRQRRDLRLALTIFFTAGLVLAVLCIPFALNFIYVNRNIDHEVSDAVTGIISLVNRTPIAWSIIWRRMTDTLTGMLSIWPMLAWIVVIAGVIWASPRIRTAQWICVALIGFNVFYTFVLAIWPGTVHIVFFIPFLRLFLQRHSINCLRWGDGQDILHNYYAYW